MLKQAPDLIRKRYAIADRNENEICLADNCLVNFSSNDYLGIATHPAIKKAFIKGVERYGFGSGGSALVSGFYRPHRALEEKFAEFLQRDDAVLFNSGYHANLGVISAVANRHSAIFLDKLCHASIIDGVHLSRAHYFRYAHQDLNHLCRLADESEANNKFLITESVFSMEGNISPIDQIAILAKTKQMKLLVDDAHGIGVLGAAGRGICDYYQLNQDSVPYLIAPLGKAFASYGAVVAGSRDFIEHLLQFAKTYRYSTALPPAIASASMAALDVIQHENWRRSKLNELTRYFIKQAKERNLCLSSEAITPIKAILIGANLAALKIHQALLEKGFFISCIRPPTVPVGTARIRISLNCLHTEQNITQLLDLIADQYEKYK